MKKLFAPWRSPYSSNITTSKEQNTKSDECVFCKQIKENNDNQNFILKRYNYSFVMLNKYPYNAGHLLILPIEHVANISELNKEARIELMELITRTTDILSTSLKSDGINIGINLGKAAGAGIPSHLHIHVLPRWQGDTNFMPTIAETKVISFDLNKLYEQLKQKFKDLQL